MILDKPERFDFHKLENWLRRDMEKFLRHLDYLLESKKLDGVIETLKSSGITLNIFNDKVQRDKMKIIFNYIYEKVDLEGKTKLEKLMKDSKKIEFVFQLQNESRERFFENAQGYNKDFEVVSYLISLEVYLRKIKDSTVESIENTKKLTEKVNIFESIIESTGMILKNFIYNKNLFKGSKRNISLKVLDVAERHILFSLLWNEFNDLVEYWKYSDVSISMLENGKIFIDLIDNDFELNNFISNERFVNLREGWQINTIVQILSEQSGDKENEEKFVSDGMKELEILFATLYFGSPMLNEKVEQIEIVAWIKAYQLLIDESKKYLKKQKKITAFNLENVCLSKSKYEWEKFYRQNGFSDEESKIIIEFFTFNSKSIDLIDCPFVEIDDKLVIIPSITSQADSSRAVASNFLTRNINLNFKGTGFEDRTKAGLDLAGIKNGELYKKVDETEYECDVAFIIEDALFFVECKAHVQPYTSRQHANHLHKIYKETEQLNRIADFYESHLPFVREQLKLKDDFIPSEIHRILLTTSMVGTPMCINGVYVIDESSLTMFIDRTPPSLKVIDNKNGVYESYSTKIYDIFEGELTSRKMMDFLNSPPQIEIVKDFYRERVINTPFYSYRRNIKENQTVHINANITDMEKLLIHKHFGKIDLSVES